MHTRGWRGECVDFLPGRRTRFVAYSIFPYEKEAKRKNGNKRSKGRRRVHPFDIEPVARKLAARTTRRFIGNDPTCETLLRRCFSRIEKLVNYIPPTTPFFGVASRSRNREANPAKNESRVTWKIHGTKR